MKAQEERQQMLIDNFRVSLYIILLLLPSIIFLYDGLVHVLSLYIYHMLLPPRYWYRDRFIKHANSPD